MLRIKEAKEEDLKEIVKIERELFVEEAWNYKQIYQEFKNLFSKIYLLKENDKILGYLIFRIIFPETELLRIGVKKEFQKKGLGTFLMNSFLKEQQKEGIKKIFLEVNNSNNLAYKFYRKFGFQDLYFRKRYYKNGDAVIMQKSL